MNHLYYKVAFGGPRYETPNKRLVIFIYKALLLKGSNSTPLQSIHPTLFFSSPACGMITLAVIGIFSKTVRERDAYSLCI